MTHDAMKIPLNQLIKLLCENCLFNVSKSLWMRQKLEICDACQKKVEEYFK